MKNYRLIRPTNTSRWKFKFLSYFLSFGKFNGLLFMLHVLPLLLFYIIRANNYPRQISGFGKCFRWGKVGKYWPLWRKSGIIVDIRLTNSKFINQKKYIFYNCTKILCLHIKIWSNRLGMGNINQSSNWRGRFRSKSLNTPRVEDTDFQNRGL